MASCDCCAGVLISTWGDFIHDRAISDAYFVVPDVAYRPHQGSQRALILHDGNECTMTADHNPSSQI